MPHRMDGPSGKESLSCKRFAWFRAIIDPLKPLFKEVVVISAFTNLLALAVPIFTLQVYDRVVGHNATQTLAALAIGVAIALAFDFLLRQGRSRLLQHAAVQIDARLGRKLYHQFSTLPLRTLESKPTGFWRSLFSDVQLVRQVFSGPTAVLIADLPFALLFIFVVFTIALPVAWILLLIVPAFLLLTYYSTRIVNLATARERRKGLTRDGLISELLVGRTTVKALMIDTAIRPEFERLHAESILEGFERGKRSDSFITLGITLSTFTTAAMVTVGALAIIAGELTIGALIATTMLTGRIIAPMNQLLSSWRQFAACRQSLKHLDSVFSLPGELETPAITRDRPKGVLQIENLSFAYASDQQPVVKDINLQFMPGELVGIIGRNGCGKTTLIKLLQGLYAPTKGRILLDGADITQFTRGEMAEWVGYVPQECFLFSGTIKENIAKAWPEADDASILAAAKLAGADQFIIDLPDGYNHQIGEDGTRLSGGQRQRIAIARALLRNPPVLLCDEITSNLDNQTEMNLRNHLLQLAKGRTILMATHSMILLRACHKILVMENGSVSMFGETSKLLAKITGQDPATPSGGSTA